MKEIFGAFKTRMVFYITYVNMTVYKETMAPKYYIAFFFNQTPTFLL